MATTPRLTKNSRPVQVLREKYENGDISDTTKPKEVWKSDPIFRAHTLNTFRNCFNKIENDVKSDNGT